MGKALKIRDDLPAEAFRRAVRRGNDGRAAARIYAIAHALDGLSRAEAARLAGMERQALRDAVVRYNAEGLAGLHDRPRGRPRRRLDHEEEADLVAAIERGPDPDADGCCSCGDGRGGGSGNAKTAPSSARRGRSSRRWSPAERPQAGLDPEAAAVRRSAPASSPRTGCPRHKPQASRPSRARTPAGGAACTRRPPRAAGRRRCRARCAAARARWSK